MSGLASDLIFTDKKNYACDLEQKLKSKEATIGVVGLGYVGLPTAVKKARDGYKVMGFDVDNRKIDSINKGINYISDVDDEELSKLVSGGRLQATSLFELVKHMDILTICVPTPVDQYKQPNMSYVTSAISNISKFAQKGQLIILESTTYPGTTQEIIITQLEKSGFTPGEDIFVAYTPERIDPGNRSFSLSNTPKVVGGMNEESTNLAALFVGNNVHRVSSTEVAEMAKVFENAFRFVNIGFVNEMTMICERLGINMWEVIEASNTKPYGFMPFYPGVGIGGHCIPVDPYYLTWKAKEKHITSRYIELSGQINDTMPSYIEYRVQKMLNSKRKAISDSNIVLLGVSYKKDINDMRESPVLPVIENLENLGANLTICDPHVGTFAVNNKIYNTIPCTEDVIKNSDLVILTTNHSDFNYEMIAKQASLLFDTKNAFQHISEFKGYYEIL
ncbi:UDP-N-acetyl-D-glucosamine dehydrogenase [Fictibacillus halophilus]|uniref:UDP-N-acetyl-D-glucosamine dehydrogenase n=1 Tax=Fictibacillus halophilus TaxID=1610490 RepID=A0ABV2LEG1_9BACL|nr:nucleotide sugar dehydrogenase [Fictibacillus halophilus]